MPLYDFRCEKCEHTWEDVVPASEAKQYAPECPECNSNFTKMIWTKAPSSTREYNPYDALDRPIPDGKRIFSGPKVSSK